MQEFLSTPETASSQHEAEIREASKANLTSALELAKATLSEHDLVETLEDFRIGTSGRTAARVILDAQLGPRTRRELIIRSALAVRRAENKARQDSNQFKDD